MLGSLVQLRLQIAVANGYLFKSRESLGLGSIPSKPREEQYFTEKNKGFCSRTNLGFSLASYELILGVVSTRRFAGLQWLVVIIFFGTIGELTSYMK